MPAIPGVPGDIALKNGPILLGNLFAYGLLGILVIQVFVYHFHFPNDPWMMKVLVWSVFSVDVLITIFATIAAWNTLAGGWGDLAVLAPLDWPYGGLPFLSGLVSSLIHAFFCWRMWKLRKLIVFPVIIIILSLLQWAMASFCGIHGRQLGITKINDLEPYVIVWLGGVTLCDALITISMVMILFKEGSKSAFKETNSVLAKLIRLTVETGMTTAVGALTELILFIIFPHNNMHFLPFLMLAKLYSNTLLATLNSRTIINATRSPFKAPPPLWNDGGPAPHVVVAGFPPHPHTLPNGVHIMTVTERREDMDIGLVSNRHFSGFYADQKRPIGDLSHLPSGIQ